MERIEDEYDVDTSRRKSFFAWFARCAYCGPFRRALHSVGASILFHSTLNVLARTKYIVDSPSSLVSLSYSHLGPSVRKSIFCNRFAPTCPRTTYGPIQMKAYIIVLDMN